MMRNQPPRCLRLWAESSERTPMMSGLSMLAAMQSLSVKRARRVRMSKDVLRASAMHGCAISGRRFQTSTGQITGPIELADYLRTLDVSPVEGETLNGDRLVSAFVRDILLGGAGTLIINNTFVEWSAIQAMKRAQPHVLVARFGVRYKMKPFSSMLLFSKPRPTDKIPWMLDPWGSFIDVEVLSYYIWLKSQQLTPYRGKTLYLLLADGVEEMMVVKPDQSTAFPKASQGAVRLSDVAATMAEWMGVTLPGATGRAMMALLS